MASLDFLLRMDHVLSARVEARKAREAKPQRRVLQAASVVAGTVACFFLLKAVALAHNGNAFAAPVPAEAGLGTQIYHWLADPDPISGTLAAALRNGTPHFYPAAGTH